jgi:hypothetical protein
LRCGHHTIGICHRICWQWIIVVSKDKQSRPCLGIVGGGIPRFALSSNLPLYPLAYSYRIPVPSSSIRLIGPLNQIPSIMGKCAAAAALLSPLKT